MKSVLRVRSNFGLARSARLASLLLLPLCAVAHSQNAGTANNLERGRELLDADDVRAVETLRAASQDALNAVAQASAAATAAGSTRLSVEVLEDARERAAEAHLLWGEAADRFSRRDEAIAAYSRAIALALGPKPDVGGIVTPRVARDARSAISGLLRAGLPMQAPDDVLTTLAHSVQGDLWAPRRFSLKLPASIAAPGTPASGPAAPGMVEFLVTDGKLFPPENPNAAPGMSRLARVAPLYKSVAADALPSSLKMDRVLYGYARELSGPSRGLWRQVARVYYASNYLTRDNRDDRPRATVLCEQFLRTWALSRNALGLDNPFAADGVTTLWLIEVSSWWPEDDDDPFIAAKLPPKMPTPNTPLKPNEAAVPPVATSPLTRPWRASAQMDSAPGEILFFKAGYPREEAEWLRQLTHEYGHVTLPPFEGFAPPLEPLGNGALGETLTALWISGDANEWSPSETAIAALKKAAPRAPAVDDDAPDAVPTFIEFDRTAFGSALTRHASVNALAAFESWKTSGPNSPLARDTSREGLRYLVGAALGIERVYGAPMLGSTLRVLSAQQKTAPRVADLLGAFANAQSDAPLRPIWLAGALETPIADVAALRERRAVSLRQGQAAAAWLYVPPGARGLRIYYAATQGNSKTLPRISQLGKNSVARAEKNGFSSLIPLDGVRGWTRLQFQAYANVAVGLAEWEK